MNERSTMQNEKSTIQEALAAKETATSIERPLTVYRKATSLDALGKLGEDLQAFIKSAADNPGIRLVQDHGRLFLRVELEITVDPSQLPQQSQAYNFGKGIFGSGMGMPGTIESITSTPVTPT